MKKALVIGTLAVASLIFVGCQQKPAEQLPSTTPSIPQEESSTATITIEQPQTSSSKATLEILPSTEQTTAPAVDTSVMTQVTTSPETATGLIPEPTPVTSTNPTETP